MSAPELSAEERAVVERFEAAPELPEAFRWDCICGSGDYGAWHSLFCAIHNTPDDEWNASS